MNDEKKDFLDDDIIYAPEPKQAETVNVADADSPTPIIIDELDGPSVQNEPETEPTAELSVESEIAAPEVVDFRAAFDEVKGKLDELTTKFEQKIAVDAHKAELFDKMYNELQSYKNDIYSKMLKPFVLSTITLIDDTNTFLSKLEENESRKAEKYLRGIPDDLADILEQNGVEIYEEEGDVFNPRTQRAMKSIPTDKPELDKTIVRRLRRGYRWQGVVLKPELVQIYKYEA